MLDLVIASKNVHKVREMRFFLKSIPGLDLYSLADFPFYVPPEENGATFEENACFKAISAAKALNKWVIADDSGLVVPALGGSPGVYSARYAGEGATDADNRKKLLREMLALSGLARTAYFECALVLASPKGLAKTVTGRSEGIILEKEKGGRGFGYDPLFIKHDYALSFGELDEAVKNLISHRAKAFEKMKLFPFENFV